MNVKQWVTDKLGDYKLVTKNAGSRPWATSVVFKMDGKNSYESTDDDIYLRISEDGGVASNVDSNKTSNTTTYIDWDTFQWGPLKADLKGTFLKEYQNNDPYSDVYEIKEGDVVVDIGASNGIYTRSIVNKKPKHVFCLEPTKTLFPYLVKNTMGYPVTHINKALSNLDGGYDHTGGSYSGPDVYECTTFNTFIKTYGIEHIDYLKTDCEGGEYNLFSPETIDFLVNNVGCIVGEFHLGNPSLEESFREFRDKYLVRFRYYKIYNVLGGDITANIWTDHFIKHYREIIVHISNKS